MGSNIKLGAMGCTFVAFSDEKKKRITIFTRPAPAGLIRLEPVVFNCSLVHSLPVVQVIYAAYTYTDNGNIFFPGLYSCDSLH